MFFLQRPKRQTIRNPWTPRRNRQTVSTAVLSGLGFVLLATLLGMAWLVMQAFQKPAVLPNDAIPNNIRKPSSSANTKPDLNPSVAISDSNPAKTVDEKAQQQQQAPPIHHDPYPVAKNKNRPVAPIRKDKQPDIPLDEDQVGTDRPNTIDAFRKAFSERYGPDVSNILRQQAMQTFGSLQATANRFLQALDERRPFRLGFAGYSITVGRGNHFHQSYPFVLYHLLEPLLQDNLGLPLTVKNAAIGGIPSFPYGFCLEHFLGVEQFDMVSWDYSMNEGGNTAVLEAYIRHTQQAYPDTRPLILAMDKHKGRCQLLDEYTKKGFLRDALCVAKASEIIPKSFLEEKADEAELPAGLQKWSEFGAPKRCPGRGSWHPKKMEHAAIAWTIATYFVDALELAIEQRPSASFQADEGPIIFPPPLSTSLPENPPAVQSLLYGHAGNANTDYRMHTLSCRTNFEPAADQENLLTSIVTAGLVPDASADTILDKRSDEWYTKGWVLDVSELERDTKIKVDKCGGLGYIDMKMALYGVAASGPLDLWLPVEESGHERHNHVTNDDTEALHWIESVVICEANEKRPDTACRLTHDLQYTVGGIAVESPVPVLNGAGEYLKRPTCVAVAIPSGARLIQNDDDAWGLSVRVQAASHITREGGACCLSHVVWEHALHEE